MLTGHPSTTGDDRPLNTTTLLRRAAAFFPDVEVVHRTAAGDWQRSTYAEEHRRISRIAHALRGLGIGAGDVVGVLDWNSRRHAELYFALPGIAATLLQLNLRLSAEDMRYVIEHSGASWICVDESLLPLAEAHAQAPGIRGWIVLSDRPGEQIRTTLPDPVFLEDRLAAQGPEEQEYPWEDVEATTAAFAGYTTGTTGRPKGVFYSHRAVYLHALHVTSMLGLNQTDVGMPVTPMFHVMSWGFPQAGMAAGAKMVYPGRYQAEDIAELAEAIVREGVTVTSGAPVIFAPLLEYYRQREQTPDLTGLRLISGGSEPPTALLRGFRELTGAEVVHGYGATESTPVAALNAVLPPAARQWSEERRWDLRRKQGIPPVNVELKIVDALGQTLPHDGVSAGEVLFRGPTITSSYWDRPDSGESFADGWWRSGDVGTIDELGYLKITDRIKDVIKSGGEWISSIDMENAILDDPRIAEAAVIGVPDPQWDERPVAYVVPRPGREVDDADVLATLRGRFAKWQLPERILLVEELPKTSVGKLNKKKLREDWQG